MICKLKRTSFPFPLHATFLPVPVAKSQSQCSKSHFPSPKIGKSQLPFYPFMTLTEGSFQIYDNPPPSFLYGCPPPQPCAKVIWRQNWQILSTRHSQFVANLHLLEKITFTNRVAKRWFSLTAVIRNENVIANASLRLFISPQIR